MFGTPPQGRADYAFIQHIIASMDEKTGRCAILLPHGVLFRDEESEIRKSLVQSDLVDCVIGLGPNLFYNSPMEACIIICNRNKPVERKQRILMINAISDVTRRNGESFLTDQHIAKIANCYHQSAEQDGFCRLVSINELAEKNYNLNISLYAYAKQFSEESVLSLSDSITEWSNMHYSVMDSFKTMLDTLSE